MNKLLLASALLLSACVPAAQTPPVIVEEASSSRAERQVSLPEDPEHGAVTRLAVGPLEGQGGGLASGSAVVWMFADGLARVSVQLNIAETTEGKVYTAWLREADGSSWEKLGILRNERGDVRHSLKWEARKDVNRQNVLIVTLESSQAASTPGPIVAKGILKETAR